MDSTRIRSVTMRAAILWPLCLAAPGFSPSAALGIPAPVFQTPADPVPVPREPVVVYLVRHAEKADDGTDDPPLAIAGRIRVQTLKALLADVSLSHVRTTDWKRTRDTARPFAVEAGLELVMYDPRELEAVAAEIRATPGCHLVVGHSNTTPQLVAALGGDSGGEIDDLEYDRLYILVIEAGRTTVTTLLRFGEPYVKGRDFGLRANPPRRGPRGISQGSR